MDDFSLIKVLGRGTYGRVMLSEKNDTKELYAIK
jgi:serum/glucocorticoid-regulated kinase 2